MSACDRCLVRNKAICAALDPTELDVLNHMGQMHTLSAGQSLMWQQDDAAPRVANVIQGVLKLSTTMDDGREQIVGIVYPADFIGRPFGAPMRHDVVALTDAQLCIFGQSDFDSFARDHPALEHKLLQRTLTELDRARDWMVLLGRKSAPQKLATFLLNMSERLTPAGCEGPQDAASHFTLPFGRQQIADILALTIETVSRQLHVFVDQGFIRLPSRREVVIMDRQSLIALAGL